jgi:putative transposase
VADGALIDWVKTTCGWVLQTVLRPVGVKGFIVLPRRWVVERTFAWLSRYRRLSKDYEYLTAVSETMILVAMIHIMARRTLDA